MRVLSKIAISRCVQSVNETCRIICRARGEYTPIAFEMKVAHRAERQWSKQVLVFRNSVRKGVNNRPEGRLSHNGDAPYGLLCPRQPGTLASVIAWRSHAHRASLHHSRYRRARRGRIKSGGYCDASCGCEYKQCPRCGPGPSRGAGRLLSHVTEPAD